MGTNWLYMTAGACGLVMLWRQPAGRLFALWSVPLILFFCGYTVTGASPMRFTLSIYGPLWAAFFLAADRGGYGRRPWLVWLFILANVVLVCPCQRWEGPAAIFLDALPAARLVVRTLIIVVPVVSLLAILIGLRGRTRTFWLVALVIYQAGWWGFPALLLIVALGVALWDWAEEIRGRFLPPSSSDCHATP